MMSNRQVPVRIESIQKTHCQAGFALVIRPLNMPPKAPPPVIINLYDRKHMDMERCDLVRHRAYT